MYDGCTREGNVAREGLRICLLHRATLAVESPPHTTTTAVGPTESRRPSAPPGLDDDHDVYSVWVAFVRPPDCEGALDLGDHYRFRAAVRTCGEPEPAASLAEVEIEVTSLGLRRRAPRASLDLPDNQLPGYLLSCPFVICKKKKVPDRGWEGSTERGRIATPTVLGQLQNRGGDPSDRHLFSKPPRQSRSPAARRKRDNGDSILDRYLRLRALGNDDPDAVASLVTDGRGVAEVMGALWDEAEKVLDEGPSDRFAASEHLALRGMVEGWRHVIDEGMASSPTRQVIAAEEPWESQAPPPPPPRPESLGRTSHYRVHLAPDRASPGPPILPTDKISPSSFFGRSTTTTPPGT